MVHLKIKFFILLIFYKEPEDSSEGKEGMTPITDLIINISLDLPARKTTTQLAHRQVPTLSNHTELTEYLLSFFSSRWNWDSPTPSPAGECAPSPFGSGGSTLACSVADPGRLSWILIFTHPGSRIQKQQQKTGAKNFFCQTILCIHKFH